MPQSDEMVPIGGIIQWFGAIVDIPAGYVLCDGTNGTPDLREKGVRGAGGTLNPGDIGGAVDHTHASTVSAHEHANGGVVAAAGAGPANAWDGGSQSATAFQSVTVPNSDNLDPFHALAFIMRTA